MLLLERDGQSGPSGGNFPLRPDSTGISYGGADAGGVSPAPVLEAKGGETASTAAAKKIDRGHEPNDMMTVLVACGNWWELVSEW